MLEPLRQIADEIVIAADARLDQTTLAEYDAVADKLLRVEYAYTSRYLAWLYAQCSGDWILRVDADEVLSPALVAAIPELIQDRGVRQYWIPRRWLYPDTSSWLDESPWWPDFQLRLNKNDCYLRFADGQLHAGGALSQPPAAYLELPLYHLIFLSTGTQEREASTARYDAIRPGMVLPDGTPMNRRYYLPEYASSLELTTVPENDRLEIARVLSASAVTNGAIDSPIPVTTLAEADQWLEGRPFEPELYRAEILPIEKTVRMMPGEERAIHFRVTNTGVAAWPMYNPLIYQGRQVRGSYHWLKENGSVHEYNGLSTWLPRRLDPGDSTVVPLMVRAPKKKGTYVLEVDLVHEGWFGCNVRVTVEVARREFFANAPT